MTETASATSGRRDGSRGLVPLLVLYLLVPAVIAGLMMYYLAASRRAAGEFGFPLDDSWIHVRFAQNLAAGHGFSYNPGQPASTTTGPLWTLLLAFGYRVTGEYLFTAAALNWLICVLAAITAAGLARTLIPRRGFGAAAALVVAATVPLPWLALSGMEPPLFVWLTLLGILLHVRLRRTRGPGTFAPTVVFALGVLARPECVLLFPLAMLDRLLAGRYEGWGRGSALSWLKQVAIHTAIFLVIVAPLAIYNYRVIGRPLPSSYYLKAMNYGPLMALAAENDTWLVHSLVVAPLKEVGSLMVMWAGNNVMLIVPLLFGVFWIVRHSGAPARAEERSYLIPLILIVQPVAWGIATNFHRAPDFQGQRYFANLGPLYVIIAMAGLWWIIERVRPAWRRILLPAALGLVLIASLWRQPAYARLYAHNVSDITKMQVTVGRWVRDNLPKESYLCLNDVGAVAAITGCRVLDTQGLVSPETLASRTLELGRDGTWRDRSRQVLWGEEPDYFIIVTRPGRVPAPGQSPLASKELLLINNEDNITSGGPVIALYETVWCRYAREASVSQAGAAVR
ncbi:MAG: hypothetical protein JSV79_05760 [Armatimonadota bacterium]|nr:MAG: hypothetical protein JSV79_05760 [Armatimonadota bacterium]